MVGCTTIQYLAGAKSTLAVCTWARETKIKVRTKDFVLVKSKNEACTSTYNDGHTSTRSRCPPAQGIKERDERDIPAEVVRKEFSLTPHTGISSSTYQSFWFLNRFWEISGYPGVYTHGSRDCQMRMNSFERLETKQLLSSSNSFFLDHVILLCFFSLLAFTFSFANFRFAL